MYKIWAKLYLNLEEYDAKGLVRAFFGALEFDPRNSLVIRGEEAKVEIVFDTTPPSDIIEAISNCDIMELNFGKVLEEYNGESEPESEMAEVEEAEAPQSEAEPAEVEEVEVPQSEAEPAKVEEAEVPQSEAETVEVEEAEAPQSEAEPAEVEEAEVPQSEAEPAEVEEEEVPQPETESEEAEEEEKSQPKTEPEEAEEEETPQPESESAEVKEEEKSQPKTKKKGRPKVLGPETVNIPYLKELAEKATSFEHFVKLVAEWLEMGKYQEFFENLEIAATQVSKMSWSELKKALARNKVYYTESTKIRTVKHVSEKIEKYNTTLLPFLGAIALYKNHSFEGQETKKETKNSESDVRPNPCREYTTEEIKIALSKDVKMDVWPKDEKKEEHSDEDENPTSVKVKMQCIPEIRSFEETLSSVDKTQPIEERVKHVLTAMGWNKKNYKEQNLILAIVRGAITVKEMNFDNIFKKAGIPVSENFMARMHLAKLINDFVKMHYPSHNMVNVLDFLKELQEIVVLESEIEGFDA